MIDKRNMKTKIWVYAVVLFTSAFIVLLITAYSQIKLNRNIVDFKTQISNQQNEKNKYQLSYANAQEMNNKLTMENEKLFAENERFSRVIDKLNSDIITIEEESLTKLMQYENLSEAQLQYLKGDIVICAQILKNTDPTAFKEKAAEAFGLLSGKAYSEAGKLLFDEGYKLYQRGKYSDAAAKFLMSRDFTKDEKYSDNCLYYLAYAQYKNGYTTTAIDLMESLIKEYPSSTYIKYARRFIQKFD